MAQTIQYLTTAFSPVAHLHSRRILLLFVVVKQLSLYIGYKKRIVT